MPTAPGTMANMILDRIIKVFQEPTTRERIQSQCIDPLIKYILNCMFPYIILICIIFCIILLLSFISVGLLILQLHPAITPSSIVSTSVAPISTSVGALAESLINTTP